MSTLIAIGGSPSASSKSTLLLEKALLQAQTHHISSSLITVRDIPAHDLVYGVGAENPHLKSITDRLALASGLVIATPIYKAAYSGALKALLDLLPQKALSGKVILPIATGGSDKHLLAIDYALKPVLFALGATQVLSGVYITDQQISKDESGHLLLDADAAQRFGEQVDLLVREVQALTA